MAQRLGPLSTKPSLWRFNVMIRLPECGIERVSECGEKSKERTHERKKMEFSWVNFVQAELLVWGRTDPHALQQAMSFVQRHINARFPSYVAKVGLAALRLAEEKFESQSTKHNEFAEEVSSVLFGGKEGGWEVCFPDACFEISTRILKITNSLASTARGNRRAKGRLRSFQKAGFETHWAQLFTETIWPSANHCHSAAKRGSAVQFVYHESWAGIVWRCLW